MTKTVVELFQKRNCSADEGEMWLRDTEVNVDALVNSNADFCNQFTMNLEELTTKELSSREKVLASLILKEEVVFQKK